MWAVSLGRNLDDDLRFGDFLSMNDAEALADFLWLSAGTSRPVPPQPVSRPRHPKAWCA